MPTEQRGIAQEVSLVTKRGVEAKNYEGVSKMQYLLFLTDMVIHFSTIFLNISLYFQNIKQKGL
jgi:hypothetical protein